MPRASPTRSGRLRSVEVGAERGNVKKALAVALIVGFLLVDFLFFHDVFKAGETVTFAQYLTGVLSIPVLVVSALYLLRGTRTVQK